MKLSVNRRVCTSYANCVDAAPDFFDLGDDGKAIVLDTPNTEEQIQEVRRASRLCPVKAVVMDGS